MIQLGIGTTRVLQIDTPERDSADTRWWFTMLDAKTRTAWALRHIEAPETGNEDFEHWLTVNVPPTEHLNVPRVWAAIDLVKKSQALRGVKPIISGS